MAEKNSQLNIKTCITSEIVSHEWSSYISNFNITFEKDFDSAHLKHKYSSSSEGYSFHALLLDENKDVVGACTLIPYIYKRNGNPLKIALAVDLFVIPEYRNDSLIFLKFYINLKKKISGIGIFAVIAVPNSNSYLYWKKIIKFRDVGTLSYLIFPVRLGNIMKKFFFLNQISLLYAIINLRLNSIIAQVYNSKVNSSVYEIDSNEKFLNARFLKDYEYIIEENIVCYYKIVDEDGIKTAYLLYANEYGKTTYKALIKSVRLIMKKNKVDLILYIGTLKMVQFLFLRLPKKFEPKSLPLIVDILQKENKETYKDIYDLKSWDFGLINYDVR